ncbi:ABC transporter substrate-binding protein [Atopobiaceae bacterium 24-176]
MSITQRGPGHGPYVKKEFAAEDHIVMTPNENYWGGTPKLSEVRLTCFSDDNAVTMAMQNGEIDAVAMPPASTLAALSPSGGYEVSRRTTSRADFICMNMAHPLIRNDAVRTAVSYCIDRDGYAGAVCQGNATPSWGVYSQTLPFGGTEGLLVTVDRCDVEAASLRFRDIDLLAVPDRALRPLRGPRIAYVFQNGRESLDPMFTVGWQLDETLRTHDKEVPPSYGARLLQRMGVTDPGRVLASRPPELSGGQCQRAAIALAVACGPDLLLADEPTGGLDEEARNKVGGLLRRLNEDGTALVTVTHDIAFASRMARMIAVMRDGGSSSRGLPTR